MVNQEIIWEKRSVLCTDPANMYTSMMWLFCSDYSSRRKFYTYTLGYTFQNECGGNVQTIKIGDLPNSHELGSEHTVERRAAPQNHV